MNSTLIEDTLRQLLAFFDFKVDGITVSAEADGITRVDVASPEASRLIGWHGETLNALQHLVKSIVRTKEKLERSPFIVLDVDGYRRVQEDKVRRIAEQKADFVRRTGSRIALSPMSPYFRRIVHLHVANTPALADLTTESVGEGEYRQIVMRLKEEKIRGSDELSPVIAQDDGLENLDV
ncbi:KH domain-containing protein [Candidatus Peregrinibacteria bacterium]|nr:KH domain-containing protein [Candidatus Peregrinibacteria bacterium]MBI3815977.1 KH domain-containing protein [Candidatus Peregrinibacteria bacterium]